MASAERGFVHLHLHTEYSLLDGGNRIDKLVRRVKELGMASVAVTDHGNLHGAVAFAQAARSEGIKPILGVEAYVAPGDRRDRTYTGVGDGGYHLVLLAENDEGWRNLLVLCSEAYLTGFYFKPRVDRALLAERHAGLIAINGHLGSEIGDHLLAFERTREARHWDAAVESARWHRSVFSDAGTGPRFYVELQHHVPEQNAINPHLIRLAREVECPLVCDNDSHFLRAEDHDAHDTLICISMAKLKRETDRLHYPRDLYVKSPEEMRGLFEESYGEVGRAACDETLRIADRCNVSLATGVSHAPMVRVSVRGVEDVRDEAAAWSSLPRADDPAWGGDLSRWHAEVCACFEVKPLGPGEDSPESLARARGECDAALSILARAGMIWRYGASDSTPEAAARRARLERELTILRAKNISAYFLIVWDFVNWGRSQGVPALARGSGVGTMAGYVLGLSNACPVRYGLLFERFTDPDRSEYPDIDIDMCQDGRAGVIEYVRRKYGHVAQIITFGTLKARAAVRDCARVLEMPLSDADSLARLIPEQLGITLDEAIEREPELRARLDRDEKARSVIDAARVIEGQARHASVHAAGVIVATRPLHEIVPLYRPTGAGEGEVVTQWDGPTCEKMGLLKMDFLGLRTISVLERCKRLIREGLDEGAIWSATGRGGEWAGGRGDRAGAGAEGSGRRGPGLFDPLDLDRLTYDDPRVFELFQRGDTTGVFQFESPGMRRLLHDMKPDRLEDLIAANALFRPGPMDLIPDYNRRKHGLDRVPSVHAIVDRHTAETYGVMVYQEQVMQIVHELGGIPLRAAYSLIKAISKKKEKEIEKVRPVFIAGACEKGLDKPGAQDLFEMILKFAGYGFNKSHSTGYAIVAYQTAYLKTYFPNQYMAAFLTYESAASKITDWIGYLEDCKTTRFVSGRVGVEVRPPDVNLSSSNFSVVFDPGEPRDALHGHVRFGLRGIKGVGEKAIAAIVRQRDACATEAGHSPFASLHDFCERVVPCAAGTVNKGTLESLIKSGAMDALHTRERRAAMVASIEQAVSAAQRLAEDRASGQDMLFGGGGGGEAALAAPARLASVLPWSEAEALAREKEVLGFYVSSHPLEAWRSWIAAFTTASIASMRSLGQDKRVILAGLVQSTKVLVVKSGRAAGQKMSVVTFEDLSGVAEGVLFSDAHQSYGHLLEADRALFVLGRVDLSRGEPQIMVERLAPIDAVPVEHGRLRVLVSEARVNGSGADVVDRLATLLRSHAAGTSEGAAKPSKPDAAEAPALPFDLVVETRDAWVTLQPESPARVRVARALVDDVVATLGEGSVRIVGSVAVDARPRPGGKTQGGRGR